MTTLNEARKRIFTEFVTCWAGETAIELQNEDLATEDLDEWVRVIVLQVKSKQETLAPRGSRRFERKAKVWVNIFVKGDTGTTRLDELATKARDIFEGFTLSGTSVSFLDVDVNEIGPDGDDYQYNVEAMFRYDETK